MAENSVEKAASIGPAPVSAMVAVVKDIFALLRDFTLFGAAVLLMLFPTTFNSVLTNAGFEEGTFAGLKWKRQLVESDTKIQVAQDTITTLQARNTDLLKALTDAKPGTVNVQQKSELTRLETESKNADESVSQVQASLNATLANNDPLVEKARTAVQVETLPSPAYCYQVDRIKPGRQRFSIHCHSSQSNCETARGPNPRYKQSECAKMTNLNQIAWKPRHPGFMGSWFEFQRESFDPPFPKVEK